MDNETGAQKLFMYLGLILVIIPSLLIAGFMPDWNALPSVAWIAISAVGGGVGMAGYKQPRVAAGIAGLVGGACIPIALVVYAHFRSQLSNTFYNVELLIPGFIGAVPGWIVYKVLAKLFAEPESQRDLSQ